MATLVKCALEAKYAEASQTTQWSTGTARHQIDKFTASNGTASPATIAINIVASGGTASAANLVLPAKTIAAGEVYTCPEIVGHYLNPGDFISTIAGTASAIVIRASVREIT